MRNAISLAGLLGLGTFYLLASTAGHAQGVTLEGAARSTSQFIAIKTVCGQFHRINELGLVTLIDGSIEFGHKQFGQAAFNAQTDAEMGRRRAEIEATGTSQWCAYQRGYLRDLKVPAFLD